MTFLEILRLPVTDLPIRQNERSLIKTLQQRFDQFGEVIDQSNNLTGPIHGTELNAGLFKEWNKRLRTGIIKCLEAYFAGKPGEAYEILKKFMNESNVRNYLDKNSYLDEGTRLYRIRTHSGNFPLTKKELFHIPFELRGRVHTQRYSIPGLPSLYLSNSVYVAWEEMRRPGFDKIQAALFSNTRVLQLLDLTTDIYVRNDYIQDNESYGWKLQYKIMTWPLVAACSVKARNFDDPFKPEYIIPQLLLQWINKEMLDGIKYSSTHINLQETAHAGEFYNVVLPVKTFGQESGYCGVLSDLFRSTQVIPMQLRQFVSSTDKFMGQESIMTNVNPHIQKLELIKNKRQPYSATYFGIIEHSLNGLELERIC